MFAPLFYAKYRVVSDLYKAVLPKGREEVKPQASITIGVVGGSEEMAQGINKEISGIRLVALNKSTERENLEVLEGARRTYHAYASGIMEIEIKDLKELRNIIEELVVAIEHEDTNLFALNNPDIVKLTPDTIKDISNIEDVLKRIIERIPSIRSMRTSELSVYNMRMTRIARNTSLQSFTPKTEGYLKEAREPHIVSIAANSLGELKFLAEAHRERMSLARRLDPKAAPITLQVRLAVREADSLKINNNTKQSLLKRMEIDDIVDVDKLILINETEKEALTTQDIYNRFIDKTKYKAENVAIVDTVKEERALGTIPQGIVFMEYEGIATSQVYDVILELLAHKTEAPAISGLERYREWFRFLPRIAQADMDRIRKEMEQYKKVLMAA